MPAPGWEDLGDFLDEEEFATEAVIELADGQVLPPISAIFDDPYLNAQLGEYQMDVRQPRLLCRESDVLVVRRGAYATVNGRRYDVLTAPEPDGTGMATVMLGEDAGDVAF